MLIPDTVYIMLIASTSNAAAMFLDTTVYAALPETIRSDVEALSTDYDETTMELVTKLAKSASEGDPVALAGRVHLAAVVAPVFTHVSSYFKSAGRNLSSIEVFDQLWVMLHDYWDVHTDELSLECERRRNVARGVAIRHALTPLDSLSPSARFDVYYQFIGKYYSSLDDEGMEYLVEENCSLGLMTEAISGDFNMISFGHEHRMSFLTDAQLEDYVKEVAELSEQPNLTNEDGMGDNGVYLTLEYWGYMEMRAERSGHESIFESPAWILANMVHTDQREMSHFGVVTMLTEFDDELLAQIIYKCNGFNDSEFKVVADALSDITEQYGAADVDYLARIAVLSADLAPLIGKFYAAGYEDDQDSLWRALEDAYGDWSTEADVELALGKALYWYSCWSGSGVELEGDDLRWAGQHALELADHAKLLMEVGPRDRAAYEKMLERPALASGVL